MISVGIAQIPNSTDLAQNYAAIKKHLDLFAKTEVSLILFPECSLSGFSSKMRECTRPALQNFLDDIQQWSLSTGIDVVLPTAFVEEDKVFNSGFWFKGAECQQFFKLGLTDSEKKFFATPTHTQKTFEVKDYKFAVLICYEAEHEAWTYFSKDSVDAILWPGYWGWTLNEEWEANRSPEKINPIFQNMLSWQRPLLQANFSVNDLEGHKTAGPEGLSYIINSDNTRLHRGPHLQSDGFIVHLDRKDGVAFVKGIQTLI